MIETVVTPPIPGAARIYDVTWPASGLGLIPANGTNVGLPGFIGRQNAGAPAVGNSSSQQLSGSGATVKWATGAAGEGYIGRAAVVLRPGTGAPGTGAVQTMDAMYITPTIGPSSGQGDNSATDDWAVWRCFAIMAFNTFQDSYAFDTGITWLCNNAATFEIGGGVCSGFGFVQKGPNLVQFVINQINGAANPRFTTVLATAAIGNWNTYEIRVIGATPTKNAVLKVLLNGKQVVAFDWVTDSLPTPIAGNGVYGFGTTLVAHGAGPSGGAATGVFFNRVRFMVGPTEQSVAV